MTHEPRCPNCGTVTERIVELDADGNIVTDLEALCDGCQADRAVEAATHGVDNDVWGGATLE